MIRTQVLKHLPGAIEGENEGSKEDVTGEAMEKSRYGKEVRRDDPIKYFFPAGCRKCLLSSRGMMAVEVPQNEEICKGGKNGTSKGVGLAERFAVEIGVAGGRIITIQGHNRGVEQG